MKKSYIVISLFFIISSNLYAKNLSAHVHGAVHLDIATDKNELLVMLKTPAESFLGFEYAAKTQKEKNQVAKAKKDWNKNLINFLGKSSLSDCKITKTTWNQKFSGSNHSSIIAESYINCSSPLKNRTLEVSFKKEYSHIKTIHLQLLRDDGSVLNNKYQKKTFTISL